MTVQEIPTIFLLTFLFLLVSSTKTQLVGTRKSCSIEGAKISVDQIDKQKCYSCVCKNGYVMCTDGCPSIQGCYMLVEDKCCKRKCKGCIYENTHHPSDSEWINPKDPCTILRCEAGIITMSQLRCHTPCSNPLPPEPGNCCPTCPECKMNDQIVTDDRDVISDDPCLKCRCNGGRMVCAKKACPVLQCTPVRQFHPPGECCPRCKGTRFLLTPPNSCTIQNIYSREGNSISMDKCTNCTCKNETSICSRYTCPILDCAPELQKPAPGSCCKKCELPEEFKSDCYFDSKLYQDGEQWKLGECKSCICQRGITRCAITRCNMTSSSSTCAYGYKFQKLPGECCPRCVELDGACMVFGDPHYKTFDGKIYTFKGIGKYQLAADCANHTFFVRVANVLVDGTSSTTRRVSVKYLNARLNLQQRGRIKFNGSVIAAPFKVDGRFRADKKKDNSIEIVLQNGVKIFWNFRSFAEVTVPARFKSKVCGLCGNFNFDVQDDLTTKLGKVVSDKEILAFGASWCLGKKTECAKKIRPQIVKTSRKNACKHLSSDIFRTCHSKLNFSKYLKACKMDVYHCKGFKCYCDSLMAYARECERLGVDLPNWQKHSYCDRDNLKGTKRRINRVHKIHRSQEALLLKKLPHRLLNRTRSNPMGVPLT
ncbi:unnamed protein product [Phyllotreta striolata]|uniref:BMP-binding endothelial regulator protein n=1 Tax=Phyllotreta striolata TaxID=444603 RepID=A0A9N9TS85_PHYSR|nr:unnamed protein product [Phyllotreta striolata]